MPELKLEDLPFKVGDLVIAGKLKVQPATRRLVGSQWVIEGGGSRMPEPAPIDAIEIRQHGPVYLVKGHWFEQSHVSKAEG